MLVIEMSEDKYALVFCWGSGRRTSILTGLNQESLAGVVERLRACSEADLFLDLIFQIPDGELYDGDAVEHGFVHQSHASIVEGHVFAE